MRVIIELPDGVGAHAPAEQASIPTLNAGPPSGVPPGTIADTEGEHRETESLSAEVATFDAIDAGPPDARIMEAMEDVGLTGAAPDAVTFPPPTAEGGQWLGAPMGNVVVELFRGGAGEQTWRIRTPDDGARA